jgi:uncharacterized protein YjbJ (UPF0337 family)
MSSVRCQEGRRQKAEGRRQKAEGRRQKAEGRRQKAEGRITPACSDPDFKLLVNHLFLL